MGYEGTGIADLAGEDGTTSVAAGRRLGSRFLDSAVAGYGYIGASGSHCRRSEGCRRVVV